MKIYIDGDASPVVEECQFLAEKHALELVLVKNYAHHYESDEFEVVTVDMGADAADLYISNHLQEDDFVVTQDYGLALLALTKKAHPILANGQVLNDKNIHAFLAQRDHRARMRKMGLKHRNPRKRRLEDDQRFLKAFDQLILDVKKDRS